MVCGAHVMNWSHDRLVKKATQLDKEKYFINQWARFAIKKSMIRKARELGITLGGRPIKCFADIGQCWKKAALQRSKTGEVGHAIFLIGTGMWDLSSDWSRVLEKKFMEERGIQYADDGQVQGGVFKGCIAKLVAYQKVQLVKAIRKPAQREGLPFISTKRSSADMMSQVGQGKYSRRKKECFDASFIKTVGTARKRGEPVWDMEQRDGGGDSGMDSDTMANVSGGSCDSVIFCETNRFGENITIVIGERPWSAKY